MASHFFVYGRHGRLLGVYGDRGRPLQEAVYLGDSLVALLRPAANGNTDVDFVFTDQLGAPRLVTNAANRPLWRWSADPFGNAPPDPDPSRSGVHFVNPLRFPGQVFDRETGLHYNYFRVYDPTTGRYIQSDPIGLAGGSNVYGYANQNPLTFTDPLGLDPFGRGNTTTSPGIPGPPTEVFIPGTPANNAFVQSVYQVANAVKNICGTKACSQCTPYPAGTIGYIGPHTDHDHHPVGRPHLNLFVVNQSSNCKCFWNKAKPDVASPPPAPSWIDLNNGFPTLSP